MVSEIVKSLNGEQASAFYRTFVTVMMMAIVGLLTWSTIETQKGSVQRAVLASEVGNIRENVAELKLLSKEMASVRADVKQNATDINENTREITEFRNDLREIIEELRSIKIEIRENRNAGSRSNLP